MKTKPASRPKDWSGFLASESRATADFMASDVERDSLPSQERAPSSFSQQDAFN